jgi:hypothetical protein
MFLTYNHQAPGAWLLLPSTCLWYLVTLEQGASIFLSLISGSAAHKILRDAAEEYGNPHAGIYQLQKSSEYIPAIMPFHIS